MERSCSTTPQGCTSVYSQPTALTTHQVPIFFEGDELLEVMSEDVATKSSFLELPSENTTPLKAYASQLLLLSNPAEK